MLKIFLEKKPLYYKEIDYDRMPRIYKRIKKFLPTPKIIHIVGTNAKGTTGRFLATALYNLGFKTMHYTSPHILKFNERIWYKGKDIDDIRLYKAHMNLQSILTKEESDSLSYFEYTTFLAILLCDDIDYLVMEAGLGGEHDATAVFENILSVLTVVGMDHEAFLGDTIEDIATTKLNAVQKNLIIGSQKFSVVEDMAMKKNANIYRYTELLSQSDIDKTKQISKMLTLAPYLVENLRLAVSVLKFLGIDYECGSFEDSKLFGRFSKISENIIIDVGHNPLAAQSIREAVGDKKIVLVYNSYADKEYKRVLEILKPIIESVEIIEIKEDRIVQKELLQNTLKLLEIKYSTFKKLKPNCNYLVFGSFSVVEQFLKVLNG